MLVKLQTKTSVKSSQLLMLEGLRLLSHVRAMPCSIRGTYFTATRRLPLAMLTAVEYGVVDEPIFRLHRAVVLGRVSGEREPFGEGLVADAGAKAWRADIVFFF